MYNYIFILWMHIYIYKASLYIYVLFFLPLHEIPTSSFSILPAPLPRLLSTWRDLWPRPPRCSHFRAVADWWTRHHKSWPTWRKISADFVTKVPWALKRCENMSVGVGFHLYSTLVFLHVFTEYRRFWIDAFLEWTGSEFPLSCFKRKGKQIFAIQIHRVFTEHSRIPYESCKSVVKVRKELVILHLLQSRWSKRRWNSRDCFGENPEKVCEWRKKSSIRNVLTIHTWHWFFAWNPMLSVGEVCVLSQMIQ